MKKQPKAVYIIENGGYTELTYEEFRRREQICPLYADKLFLPLYGRLMEVSKEDYTEFYRAKRRQKYLDERSADNGDFSYDMLTTDEFSGEDILIAEQPDVCDTVVESIKCKSEVRGFKSESANIAFLFIGFPSNCRRQKSEPIHPNFLIFHRIIKRFKKN